MPLRTAVSELVSVLTKLEHGDFESRWETVKHIPTFGDSAIAVLIDLLHSSGDDPELQWFVAQILGQYDHADAVMALAQLLQETNEDDVAAMAAQMLAQVGPQAVDTLAPLLLSSPSRLLVVSALSQIQDAVIVPLLIKVATDQDAAVRLQVMEALSRFHDPQIIPVLCQGLHDVNAKVRQAATLAISYRASLCQEQGQDPVALIQPCLQDLDLQVCRAAALALGRLATNESAQALVKTAQSATIPMPLMVTIVQALGQVGSHQSIQYLQDLWPYQSSSMQMIEDHEQTVAMAIVNALTLNRQTGLREVSARALIDCLHHQSGYDLALYKTIATALGQVGDTTALPTLIRLLGIADMGVRLHAIAALKQIAPEEAYAQLQALVAEDTLVENMRDGVAIALQEW